VLFLFVLFRIFADLDFYSKYVVQGYAYQVPAALEAFLVPQDNATAFSAAIAAAAGSKHQDNFQQDD
jgi:hypothetical protein